METRYKDNGDGTILDNKTGLVWQTEYAGPMTWAEAMEYAQTLDLAGHKDWRLPTVEELFTLVDFNKSSPASEFPGMLSDGFWTSASYERHTIYAWRINFTTGYISDYLKLYRYYVRCVRAEKKP